MKNEIKEKNENEIYGKNEIVRKMERLFRQMIGWIDRQIYR